ncbi:MAG TPA: ATP-dependent DNA ligase [Bryobacteraceae bacterium]|jgi:DNA ligase-1|nr:ATP-dependent DNA ligase [Bryobacteraceae bacterium]
MDELALVCEEVARSASRLRKIAALAAYFRKLNDDDLALAVQFLSGGPVARESPNHTLFAKEEKVKLSVGYSLLRESLQAATGWDWETLRICYSEVGDGAETAGLLLRGIAAELPLSLADADEIYQKLFRARLTARKLEILIDAQRRYRPLTIKYFLKVITRGLRIGLQGKLVEEAVAAACGVCHESVRDAANRLGDLARVAVAARRGELAEIEARLFHPMEFMLAKPLERLEDITEPADWIIEDKYDGIRSQAHFEAGHVQIFSRGMEDVTAPFPELRDALRGLEGNGLLDGEVLAWRDGRALNFNVLQQRIARKRVRATLMAEIPLVFMAYDILLRNDELLLKKPFEERRSILSKTLNGQPLPILISPQYAIETREDLDRLFGEARARGNEGLVLKRKGSLYEPGRRSGAWHKLKRPYATLDVVITAAEQGNGRRATVFSDYTFAVRSENGFVNVGKAYSGLTDEEIRELTRLLRAASTDRFGRVMLVKPEIVLEVAFDGVQKSPRHKSGYALRFPRIVRWRKDKRPEDSDDLTRVAALYQATLN